MPSEPAALVSRALAVLGRPADQRDDARRRSSATRPARWAPPHAAWEREQYPVLALNALRMLIAVCPDELTS